MISPNYQTNNVFYGVDNDAKKDSFELKKTDFKPWFFEEDFKSTNNTEGFYLTSSECFLNDLNNNLKVDLIHRQRNSRIAHFDNIFNNSVKNKSKNLNYQQDNSRQVKFDLKKQERTKFSNIDEFIKHPGKLGNILTRNFLKKSSILNMSNPENPKVVIQKNDKMTDSLCDVSEESIRDNSMKESHIDPDLVPNQIEISQKEKAIEESEIKSDEVEYQLSRSFETETLTRAKSVDFNLNIENSINNAKNTFILDPSKNELSQTKQDFLNKRLYMMQEELNKTKLELDQCYSMRENEINRIKQLEQELNIFDVRKQNPTNKCAQNQVELINQITKLKASEGLLLEQLEKDRTEIKLLNDQLFESNYLNLKHKKYKNNELNDSLDSISNSLHSNFGTVFNSYNKSPDDRDEIYNEIIEKLKFYGFNSTSNQKDIICFLYHQYKDAIDIVNEFEFYMKQMKINCEDPINGIKTLYSQVNSSQNDINCLNQKLELLRLELDLQKKEYVKHISFILEKSQIDSILIEEIETTQDSTKEYSFLESRDEGLAGESAMDMPVFKNCAYLSRQKTVTIPSFQNNSFYVIDDDLKEEEKSFQCYEMNYDDSICISKMDISSRSNFYPVDKSNSQIKVDYNNTKQKKDLPPNMKNSQTNNYEESVNSLLKQLADLKAENEKLKHEVEKVNKNNIELLQDSQISSGYEDEVKKLSQEIVTLKSDNTNLKEEHKKLHKNNLDLLQDSQIIGNYEEELKIMEDQLTNYKNDHEHLLAEFTKLYNSNHELLQAQSKRSADANNQSMSNRSFMNRSKLENIEEIDDELCQKTPEELLEKIAHDKQNHAREITTMKDQIFKLECENKNLMNEFEILAKHNKEASLKSRSDSSLQNNDFSNFDDDLESDQIYLKASEATELENSNSKEKKSPELIELIAKYETELKNKELEIENYKEEYAELLTSFNELFKVKNDQSKQNKNLNLEDQDDMKTIGVKSIMSRNIPADNFQSFDNEGDLKQKIEEEFLIKIGQEREKYDAEIENLQEEIAQRVESEKQKYEENKTALQEEILKLKSANENLVLEIKSIQEDEAVTVLNLQEKLENDIQELKLEKQEFQNEAQDVIDELNNKLQEASNEKQLILKNIELERDQFVKQLSENQVQLEENIIKNNDTDAKSIEARDIILKLTDDLNEANEKRNFLDKQVVNLHDDIREYEANSAKIKGQYDQQLHYLEEQLQLYQAVTAKIRNENNELRINQTKNNSELTQIVGNYDETIRGLRNDVEKFKNENEILKSDHDKLYKNNQDLLEILNKNEDQKDNEKSILEKETKKLRNKLQKINNERENVNNEITKYTNEINNLNLLHIRNNEEFQNKLFEHEAEIVNLTKELTKSKLQSENLELDLDQKDDEILHLNETLNEFREFKENYILNEERLNSQKKKNERMQAKLICLQNDLLSKDIEINNASMISRNEPSQETTIDNLKFLIQEQLNDRKAAALNEIEELKFTVHDLRSKLSHEKQQNESLETKFKLVDQDNKSLRQTLLTTSKKFDSANKVKRNSIDEINELIETAQKNYERTAILNNQNSMANHLSDVTIVN